MINQEPYNYGDFLLKLIMFGKINHYDAEIEMGKYFKYPMCCVKFFARYGEMGVNAVGYYMDTMYGYDDAPYVRCPKCRRRKYG